MGRRPRSHRCAQSLAAERARSGQSQRPVPSRGTPGRAHQPPGRRAHLRRRRARRHAVHLDGVRARSPTPPGHGRRSRSARTCSFSCETDPRWPRRSPPHGRRASRPQTGEHPAVRSRPGEDPRLRSREADVQGPADSTGQLRRYHRDAALHGSGAVRGQGGRRAHGSVRARCRLVRAARRRAGPPGQKHRRPRPAGVTTRAAATRLGGPARRARRGGAPCDGARQRRTLRVRRSHARGLATARRNGLRERRKRAPQRAVLAPPAGGGLRAARARRAGRLWRGALAFGVGDVAKGDRARPEVRVGPRASRGGLCFELHARPRRRCAARPGGVVVWQSRSARPHLAGHDARAVPHPLEQDVQLPRGDRDARAVARFADRSEPRGRAADVGERDWAPRSVRPDGCGDSSPPGRGSPRSDHVVVAGRPAHPTRRPSPSDRGVVGDDAPRPGPGRCSVLVAARPREAAGR